MEDNDDDVSSGNREVRTRRSPGNGECRGGESDVDPVVSIVDGNAESVGASGQPSVTTIEPPSLTTAFGWSVARLGSLIAVGEPLYMGAVGAVGAVRLYEAVPRRGGGVDYAPCAMVEGDEPGALFGSGVVLTGEFLLVGAAFADVEGLPDAGAVHVSRRCGGAWRRATRVHAAIPTAQMRFGLTVAMHGATLAVGAPGTDSGVVDGSDLAVLLGRFGQGRGLGDLTDDGIVDAADLAALRTTWG